MITQHIRQLVSRKFNGLLRIEFVTFFSKKGGTEQCLGFALRSFVKNDFKSTISFKVRSREFVKFNMQYITAMYIQCYHPPKIREIGGALGKMTFFPTMSLYFYPSRLKIWTLPPYEIYVFGMSKTWATYC